MDEAGYLLEAFDTSKSLSVWRSAAVDLTIKLMETDFRKNAKVTDYLSQAWDRLRCVGAGDGDKVRL